MMTHEVNKTACERSRHIRITLLKALFLVGLAANLLFLPKVRLIPRPLDDNSLSALSYGSTAIDRFIPIAIFDYYHPERILIPQELMRRFQLDVDELHRLARIDTVHIISQNQEELLEVPGSEIIVERVEYPLDEKLKVVFLLAAPAKNIMTVGAVVQENAIIFFPLEYK